MGADALEQAAYGKDGKLTLSFSCPRCGCPITVACEPRDEARGAITGLVMQVAAESIRAGEMRIVRDGVEDERFSGRPVETYNPSAQVPPASGQEAMAPSAAPEPEPAAASEPPTHGRQELRINYMTMGPTTMLTYGIELNRQPAAPAPEAEYLPTEEDEARLEYFHRQLEGLDTVDEAIDEIDTGYNLSDSDEAGE